MTPLSQSNKLFVLSKSNLFGLPTNAAGLNLAVGQIASIALGAKDVFLHGSNNVESATLHVLSCSV